LKNDERVIKDNIGETLLMTLYMKCRESKKKYPIISDKIACELVNKINYDFSKFDKANNTSVGVAIRANYFDEMLKSFIKSSQKPVIVIIGSGLDSRYERIGQVAKKAFFYQLDIPEVMQIREQLLPAHENESLVFASMFETQWMDDIKQAHPEGQFLFIIEGVLMYFKREDVKTVFQNIAEKFPDGEILFDIINVLLSKNSHRHEAVKLTNAKFIYGTNDGKEMEYWSDNLQHVSTKLLGDFKEWGRIGFAKAKLMNLIPALKYSIRMLHYKINTKA
jgi:O-methyltransferase involved in polyketide biosynthesis